jgi:hypothetical protein
MTAQLRHRCRNPRCRMKLPEPVENHHRAFCTRGCFESFYLKRCRVCERDLRKQQGKLGDANRLYCRPPSQCAAEARKWPEKYTFRASPLPHPAFHTTRVRNADSTGLKSGFEGDRPPFKCLTDWWWGGDPDNGDHSLYDKDGLTIARIMLEHDGRYHLRTPVTQPRMAWSDLNQAKRRAESLVLCNLPLDPKISARAKRDNETPHPMGVPLNRPDNTGDNMLLGAGSTIRFKQSDPWSDDLDIPAYLRRAD